MVNILSPKSIYIDNNDPSSYTLTWEGTISGQTAYEIMYKLKNSDVWLTAGKVNSTATTYDLRNIYDFLGIDFAEISYKVLLYYSASTGKNETTTGTEYSNTYSLIFNQGITGNINIWNGSEKETYPVFDSINNDNIHKVNINTDQGTKLAPLVDDNSPLASHFKIRISDTDTECIANKNASFTYYTPTASDIFGDFSVSGKTYYYSKNSTSYISQYSYKYYYVSSTPKDSYRNYLSSYYYYRNYLDSTYYYKYSYSYTPTRTVNEAYIFDTYKYGYGYGDRYGTFTAGFYYAVYAYHNIQASGVYYYNSLEEAYYASNTNGWRGYVSIPGAYYYYSYAYGYKNSTYYYYSYTKDTYYYYSYSYYYYNRYDSRYTSDVYRYKYYYTLDSSSYSYSYRT